MPAIISAVLVLYSLLMPVAAAAQALAAPAGVAGEIRGVVTSEAGKPLDGARVVARSLADTTRTAGAVTDAQGRFSVEGLAPGRWSVRISHLGYTTESRAEVTLPAAGADLGTVRLTPAAVAVEGMTVQGERSNVIVAADRTIYSTKDMPVAASGMATDVLRSVPELEVDVNGKVSLQGTGVQIHLDGRLAPVKGEALDQFLQQYPASRIDRVEVIQNPPAKYDAEGSGGIVNIVLKRNMSAGTSGTLGATAGTRRRGSAYGRLAHQKGRLTLFGGAGVNSWTRSVVRNELRQNLLTQPVTYLQHDQTGGHVTRSGNLDVSAELRLGEQVVAWSSVNGYYGRNEWEGGWIYNVLDAERVPLERYTRGSWSAQTGLTGDVAVGLKRTMKPQGHELSVEMRRNNYGMGKDGRYPREWVELPGIPVTRPSDNRVQRDENENDALTLQADYVRPVGKTRRVEAGYRGVLGATDSDVVQQIFSPLDAPEPRSVLQNALSYRERFHSGYLLVVQSFDKLNVQLGARAEHAATDFSVRVTGQEYDKTYTSFFPSANVSYKVEGGREVRLSYAKRIQRPWPGMLNPYDPAPDPMNRTVGNPDLDPQYSHNLNLDLSWSGQKGTLRLAPYYRQTVDSWESIKQVDQAGVSTITWTNLASNRSYGAGLTAALRPGARVSGATTLSGFQVERNTSNLSSGYSNRDFWWSLRSNATVRVSQTLNVQAMATGYSARGLPQGRVGASIYSSIGVRQQLWKQKATLNLALIDPLDLQRDRMKSRDRSHVQTSIIRARNRLATLSLSYNFGKAPTSQRKQRSGEPAAELGPQIR